MKENLNAQRVAAREAISVVVILANAESGHVAVKPTQTDQHAERQRKPKPMIHSEGHHDEPRKKGGVDRMRCSKNPALGLRSAPGV